MALRSWVAVVVMASATVAHAAPRPYQASMTHWRAAEGGFESWVLAGVALSADGALVLDRATATTGTDPYPAGGYFGRNFYNGGAFLVGEATSPITPTSFAFREAIVSWNAATPPGTWVETLARARVGTRWTKWYNLGVWADDAVTVERHSVNQQGDTDGTVVVDTLKLIYKKKDPANAYQVKVRLFTASDMVPTVNAVTLAASTTPAKPDAPAPGDPARWARTLDVPECSQMVYPDGGTVWCSPTSVAMVLDYWQPESGPCEPRVRAAVTGVYDWLYNGHGNWPFNTAYASARGFEAWVGRFTSMAEAERWIAAGVPLVISYAWGNGDLTGAPIPSSNGHLAVLVGFDDVGNPVVNDPAAATDEQVRRVYLREELEALWLEHSGGTVYAIYPSGYPIPISD